MAACGQMGRYYDLPTGIAAGMADSKLPDAQVGIRERLYDIAGGTQRRKHGLRVGRHARESARRQYGKFRH